MIMSDLYTTKTAALKATKADVSKLNTKSLKVNGKDVATSVKHPNDTREVITENDLWGSWAEIKDGEIIFHDDEITFEGLDMESYMNIVKIENNKAYNANGDLLFNIQTKNIRNYPEYVFYFDSCTNLQTFESDLSSLVDGNVFFARCENLYKFKGDLSSLEDGNEMFSMTSITSFDSKLPKLKIGSSMFSRALQMENEFECDFPSLTQAHFMFEHCNISSFKGDLSSLINGRYMFSCCKNLSSFTSDLSSLTNGSYMFAGTNGFLEEERCKLDMDSLIHIAETIKDVRDLTNGKNDYDDVFKRLDLGFSNEIPYPEQKVLLDEICEKGWDVYVNGQRYIHS